jgi:Ala-tRNA(Pro) deacylase
MIAKKLKEFLNSQGVKYVSIGHSPAYAASEVAASVHMSGRDFAKTVIVKIGGEMAMVVLPANRKIVLSDLRDMFGDPGLKLATEDEFIARFPDCELGAMPPFGNLYGLRVYLAESLTGEESIVFNAGSHREVIKMAFTDFVELVDPVVLDFATV